MKLANIAGGQRALFNVYLPKSDGTTTEIDIIILHETGIYPALTGSKTPTLK